MSRYQRATVECACGCGRVGTRRGSRGYVRACYERWVRVGCPDEGPPPAQKPGRTPGTGRPDSTYADKVARAARWSWARSVATSVAVGAAQMPTPGWEEAAVCRALPDGWSPDDWFPEVPHVPAEVRAACDRCPVRRECLVAAYLGGEKYGVWGGLTPDQRSRALAPAQAARRVAA